MNKPIRPPRPSLLERADQAFDFSAMLHGPVAGDALHPVSEPNAAGGGVAEVRAPSEHLRPVQAAEMPRQTTVATPRAASQPIQRLDSARMAEAGYLVPHAPVSGLSEEFRLVKRELLRSIRGGKGQTPLANGNIVLITSPHSGDGKSWCAINLALSLAVESDVEVLLVDGDFAKSAIPSALGLVANRGLMDALADTSIAIEDCIIPTDLPQLSVLASGMSSNLDAELLASAQMEALMKRLANARPNRIILFDSPPLLEASPAMVLAGLAGQTILVVRADRTSDAAVRDAAELIRHCNHVRLLLNGVKFSASGRRFGNYYGKES